MIIYEISPSAQSAEGLFGQTEAPERELSFIMNKIDLEYHKIKCYNYTDEILHKVSPNQSLVKLYTKKQYVPFFQNYITAILKYIIKLLFVCLYIITVAFKNCICT